MRKDELKKIKLKYRVKELIKKAKNNNNIIKSSDDAFKEFPVENEEHKGNINAYKKVSEKI